MKVPLLDLKGQYQQLKEKIDKAVQRVLTSQEFILGSEVGLLEEKMASYYGVAAAIGVASGSDALLLSLMAIDVGVGDEVITSPYTFFATASAISHVGATPVFVDIDPQSYNLDPQKLAASITPQTKAIIPVHLYGQYACMKAITAIAQQHQLAIVEDAAQAQGAEYYGKKVAGWGNLGCLSFFPSKNLGGSGDGGMVLTNNLSLAEKLRILRVHGCYPDYYHHLIGRNSRLDSLHAAVLLVKLPYLTAWIKQRQEIAQRYDTLFEAKGLLDYISPPYRAPHTKHVFNQYVIRVSRDRDLLRDFLTQNGVGTAIYYPLPLHLQPCYQHLGYHRGDFPEAEKAAHETLALPIYPELTLDQQDYVVAEISKFFTEPR